VETELGSTLGDNLTYLHSELENTVGYQQPLWWTMPDLAHSDIVDEDSDKVVSMTQNSCWRDLELTWTEMPAEDATGNIVVFADFKRPNETE
jgi:hypothetical protein